MHLIVLSWGAPSVHVFAVLAMFVGVWVEQTKAQRAYRSRAGTAHPHSFCLEFQLSKHPPYIQQGKLGCLPLLTSHLLSRLLVSFEAPEYKLCGMSHEPG